MTETFNSFIIIYCNIIISDYWLTSFTLVGYWLYMNILPQSSEFES